MATPLDRENGLNALPHLVAKAQLGETTTYGDVGEAIGKHHRRIPNALGFIRDEVCIPRGLPLINAIVIRKDTGLPGDAFLPEGTRHLSQREYADEFERFRDEVFRFDRWEDLLEELGSKPIHEAVEDVAALARAQVIHEERTGGGGEGPEHLALKQYIADAPTGVGLPADAGVKIEEQLLSGDYCDLVFRWSDGVAVVEVKRGASAELAKGIYQIIKYRAVLQAQEADREPVAIDAILAAYTMPDYIVETAAKFGIDCVRVDRSDVMGTSEE